MGHIHNSHQLKQKNKTSKLMHKEHVLRDMLDQTASFRENKTKPHCVF